MTKTGFLLGFLLMCGSTLFAQNKQDKKMIVIDDFKAGRVLTQDDINFISTFSMTTHQDAPKNDLKEASFAGNKFTLGQKLTASEASVLTKKGLRIAKLNNLKKAESRDVPCNWCYVNCNYYNYYWWHGWCWCTYCDGWRV